MKPIGLSLQVARSLILTRILAPEAFGLMSLVAVVLSGIQMCSDIGIGPSIIQHERGDDADFLRTAWTLKVLRGCAVWMLCLVIAWPVSLFYEEGALLLLIPIAGLNAIVTGFDSISFASLGRRLALGRVMILSQSTDVVGAGLTILLAFLLQNVWALVLGALLTNLLLTLLSFVILPGIRHAFRLDREAVREMVRFGRWILVSTVLTFFAGQLDRLMLGKMVTTERLGVYSIALTLAAMPRDLLIGISGSVLFPAFSEKARDDPAFFVRKFAEYRSVLLRLSMFAAAGIAIGAPAFFALYDDRYADAGWMARLLVLAGWFQVLHSTSSSALLALGDTKALMVSNAGKLLIGGLACLGGFILLGIPGFILGFGVAACSAEVIAVLLLRRCTGRLLIQDLVYSLLGLSVVLAGVWIDSLVRSRLAGAAGIAASFTVAMVVCFPIGLVCLGDFRRLLRK